MYLRSGMFAFIKETWSAVSSNRTTISGEKRRHPRTSAISGQSVVFSQGRYAGTFAIKNLSASGALLVGDVTLKFGERVKLLLELAGNRHFSMAAMVVRRGLSESGEQVFAVAFKDLSVLAETTLHQLVVQAEASTA